MFAHETCFCIIVLDVSSITFTFSGVPSARISLYERSTGLMYKHLWLGTKHLRVDSLVSESRVQGRSTHYKLYKKRRRYLPTKKLVLLATTAAGVYCKDQLCSASILQHPATTQFNTVLILFFSYSQNRIHRSYQDNSDSFVPSW